MLRCHLRDRLLHLILRHIGSVILNKAVLMRHPGRVKKLGKHGKVLANKPSLDHIKTEAEIRPLTEQGEEERHILFRLSSSQKRTTETTGGGHRG